MKIHVTSEENLSPLFSANPTYFSKFSVDLFGYPNRK